MKPTLIGGTNHLQKWQADLLNIEFVIKKARESGLVKRYRKFNPGCLLLVLVFGISCHSKPSFEEIFRNYLDFDDTEHKSGKIRIQSFAKRFNDDMVNFLSLMLDYYIDLTLLECPARLKEPLNNLKDILLQDGSIIRLSNKLAEELPAARSRGKAAGVKIHAVYSAISHSLKFVEITGECVHDSKMLIIGPDVKDKLLIFDLGYYSIKVFAKIKDRGGFFVSRLKSNATPKVLEVISSSDLIKSQFKKGMLLNDLLEKIPKTEQIDLICAFHIKKNSKKKETKDNPIKFRVVCFWDEERSIWHTYVTNLSHDNFTNDEIYQLYEYRWIIELLFKELKSDYDLGHLLLAKSPLAYTHIYSMLIRLVISRNLYKIIIHSVDEQDKYRYGPLLWSKIFAEKGKEFLSILNQQIFGKGSVRHRWEKLELSLRGLARSRHTIKRLSFKFLEF